MKTCFVEILKLDFRACFVGWSESIFERSLVCRHLLHTPNACYMKYIPKSWSLVSGLPLMYVILGAIDMKTTNILNIKPLRTLPKVASVIREHIWSVRDDVTRMRRVSIAPLSVNFCIPDKSMSECEMSMYCRCCCTKETDRSTMNCYGGQSRHR